MARHVYKFPVDEPRVHVEPGAPQSLEVLNTKRCMAPHASEVRTLRRGRLTHAEIARRLGIGESSVRRILAAKAPSPSSRRAT